MDMLCSVEDVIKAVGGSAAAAEIAQVGVSTVSNWKSLGVIPSEYFLIFAGELDRRGLRFDTAVFRFKREPA